MTARAASILSDAGRDRYPDVPTVCQRSRKVNKNPGIETAAGLPESPVHVFA